MDYSALAEQVRGLGAYKAGVVDLQDVRFDRAFRAMCETNACGNYGKCWMCPPDAGDIDALMNEAKSYQKALVYQTVGTLEDSYDFEGMMEAARLFPAPDRPDMMTNSIGTTSSAARGAPDGFSLSCSAHRRTHPRSRTSRSRVTPVSRRTRSRTWSTRASTSAQVAPPRLMTKPACFSDTWAPPTVSPFRPHWSMRAAAKWPSGRLNMEPALGYSNGCFSPRRRASSWIFSRISSGSPWKEDKGDE